LRKRISDIEKSLYGDLFFATGLLLQFRVRISTIPLPFPAL